MTRVQIIGVPQSTFVRVVRIAAEEKGIDYDLVPARPHSPEVLAQHPLGKVPVMRHGPVALCESKAIASYFDRAFPGPMLIPDDLVAAAQVEQWVSLMNSGFSPAFATYLAAYLFPGTPDGTPDRARIESVLGRVEQALGVLDRATGSGYLVAERFTYADIAVLPALYNLRRLPESGAMIAELPVLADYVEWHADRPSVQATVPPAVSAAYRASVARPAAEAVS